MDVFEKYRQITQKLIDKGITVSVMESCTSGTVASLITDTEGSSAIFRGSFVTYSNEAKIKFGVPEAIIAEYGVYSEETAKEMACASARALGADVGIGITGSLGNIDPANSDSLPGEVFFAILIKGKVISRRLTDVSGADRRQAKLTVAGYVADLLNELI